MSETGFIGFMDGQDACLNWVIRKQILQSRRDDLLVAPGPRPGVWNMVGEKVPQDSGQMPPVRFGTSRSYLPEQVPFYAKILLRYSK